MYSIKKTWLANLHDRLVTGTGVNIVVYFYLI